MISRLLFLGHSISPLIECRHYIIIQQSRFRQRITRDGAIAFRALRDKEIHYHSAGLLVIRKQRRAVSRDGLSLQQIMKMISCRLSLVAQQMPRTLSDAACATFLHSTLPLHSCHHDSGSQVNVAPRRRHYIFGDRYRASRHAFCDYFSARYHNTTRSECHSLQRFGDFSPPALLSCQRAISMHWFSIHHTHARTASMHNNRHSIAAVAAISPRRLSAFQQQEAALSNFIFHAKFSSYRPFT